LALRILASFDSVAETGREIVFRSPDVDKQDVGDLELDLFFNLSGHTDSHGNACQQMLSVRPPTVESKPRSREIAAHRNGLAHLHSIRSFFPDHRPVVQRIERRFPKGKLAFLQEFADVISSEQMTAFKRVE
jgi:hypothetical protein